MQNALRTIGIIGGGPGGLALAQGLQKHGFAVRVFERDRARSDYVQGFRLRVRERGLQALRLLLPETHIAAVFDTAGRAPATSLGFDERMQALPAATSIDASDDAQLELSISRVTLRQVLLDGLDGSIEYGKVFRAYRLDQDGQATALFDDGTEHRFDLIVGADGSRSRVRGQLLPHAKIIDTGVRRFAGKIPLDQAEGFLDRAFLDHNVTIRPPGGPSLMVTSHRVDPSRFRHRGVIGADDPTHAGLAGSHFANTVSYVWWNIAFRSGDLAPDDALQADDGAGLLARLERHLHRWDPAILELFRRTDPTTVGMLRVHSSVPPGDWPTGPVTLLGDALHAMTYFRALGANSAIYDAGLLLDALLANRAGRPALEALAAYETAARTHGYAAVEDSLAAMQRSLGVPIGAAA